MIMDEMIVDEMIVDEMIMDEMIPQFKNQGYNCYRISTPETP